MQPTTFTPFFQMRGSRKGALRSLAPKVRAVVAQMRTHYPGLANGYILFAMLMLEEIHDDSILNIAKDTKKLFFFSTTEEIVRIIGKDGLAG